LCSLGYPPATMQDRGVELSAAEYSGLKARADPAFVLPYTSGVGEDAAAARRKLLHEKSLKETAEWSGTVLGERQRRLAAKEKRKVAREKELEEIDLQEARYQAEQREKHLAWAKEMLIQQKDEIRGVRSAEFLAEVLRERDAQTDSSGDRARAMEEYYKAFDAAKAAEDEMALQAEVDKQHRHRMAALDTAKSQLEQAAEHRAARRAKRQAELDEQNRLNADSGAYFAEEQDKQRAAKGQQHKLLEAMQAATAEKRAMRAKEEELAKLEAERNAVYSEYKDEMYAERARRGADARAQVIAQREALTEKLYTEKKSNDNAEDERIATAIEEQNRKRDAAEAAKAKARATRQAEILDHMQQTIASKAAASKAEREAALAEQARVVADAEKYFEQEKQKSASRRTTVRSVQAEWDRDIALHKKQAEEARQALVQMRLDHQAEIDAEQKELRDYAAKRLAAAEARGCGNTHPMKKAIQSLEPWQPKPKPNLPSINTRRRGNPYPGDTKARLGFIM